jgi:hypothetical protein
VDALAGLRVWAYETTFPGILGRSGAPHVFRIPPRPAADWLIASFEAGHLAYLPGMLDDTEQAMILDALADGDVTHDELVEANKDALEAVSGWPWWSATKLIGVLYHRFDLLGGLLVLAGVDLQTQPLGAVLAAVNARVLENQNKEGRVKWVNELAMPPAEALDHDNWDEDAAEKALEIMMANGGGGYGDE